MLESVLRFADRPVRTIMVPRPEMVWLRADDPIEVALDATAPSGHSRFPLCASDLDDILGVVLVRDIIELIRRGGSDLREVVRDPLYVSEGIPALKLLELFRDSGLHMALVVDEYGALEGLATPTDILTSIAGELPEVGAEEEPGAVRREDGSWLMDGSLSVDRRRRHPRAEDDARRRLRDAGRAGADRDGPHPGSGRMRGRARLALRGGRHGWPPHRQAAGAAGPDGRARHRPGGGVVAHCYRSSPCYQEDALG